MHNHGCYLGFYLGALAYLAAPALGVQFDTAAIISSVAAAPVAAKFVAKTTIAAPFVYHCLNGIRHLVCFLSFYTCGMVMVMMG